MAPNLAFANSFVPSFRRRAAAPGAKCALSRRTLATATALPVKFSDIVPPTATVFSTPPSSSETDLANVISSLNDTPVLVGWLRHYGCTLCKKQATEWLTISHPNKLLIGNGTPEQAADFADEIQWPANRLYSDPARLTYAALQFAKGPSSLFTRDSLMRTIASFRAGHKQSWGRMPTDAFQQGGAIVVNTDGLVTFVHRDAYAGDHAPLDVLEDAVRDAMMTSPASA